MASVVQKLIGFIVIAAASACPAATADPFRRGTHLFRSLVVKVRVDCYTEERGGKTVTGFCEDGHVCDPTAGKWLCIPGPELQKELEADKLKKSEREARRQSRRLGGGCMSDPNFCRPTPSPQARNHQMQQSPPKCRRAGATWVWS